MTFANPWGLLALAAIPLVIVFHRVSRGRRHAVPLVTLWSPATAPAVAGARRRRIDAVLVLRVLIVIAVALGLARPGWSVPAPQRHVFVLDASASMGARDGGGSRFQEAVVAATRLLAALDARDPVMVLRAGGRTRVEHGFSTDRAAVRAALGRLAPGEAAKDLDSALSAASGALAPGGGIVDLFSDVRDAAAVMRDARRLGLRDGDVRVHAVGHAADNVAIVGLDTAPLPRSPLDHRIVARIANFSGTARTVTATLAGPGLDAKARSITLDAGEVRPIEFESAAASWLELRLENLHDALAVDDRAVLTLPGGVVRAVYVSRGDRFLDAALAAHPGLRIRRVPADGLTTVTPADADVVVVDGVIPPPSLRLPALVVHRDRAPRDASLTVPVVGWAHAHPLLRRLDLANIAVPARAVLAGGGGQTLIRSADGPVARASEVDGVRRVDLSFGIEHSTLGHTPAFPAFMARVLAWLADRGTASTGARAGRPLRIAIPTAVDAVTIVRPDRSTATVTPDGGHVEIVETEQTGLYRLEARAVSMPIAVNLLDADESNLGRGVISAPAPAASAAVSMPSERRELVRVLLAVALQLVSVETWLLHRRMRTA